jgi:AraC-like DNA-binding protein
MGVDRVLTGHGIISGMSGNREASSVRPGQSRFGRYRPGPHLSPFVRNYWTFQATGACRRQRVIPDGCIDILFVRHSPTEDLRAFVVGTMTRPIFEDLTAHAEYLGVRFAPGGFGHFFRTPARELTDRIVPWGSLSAPSALVERVANAPDIRMRLCILEEVLEQQLLSEEPEPILAAVLRAIGAARGVVSVGRLAHLAGWSPRHLRRVFHEWVGVGPKVFCEIVRFKNARRSLGRQPRPDLLQVALEAGYYDQAHFIHEFDRFYGSSPSTVRPDRGS